MTLPDTYNRFIGALATGQPGLLPAFVDPDTYTDTGAGLTGWTPGLNVALANFQYDLGAAFADLATDVRDILERPGSLVIRARGQRHPRRGVQLIHRAAVGPRTDSPLCTPSAAQDPTFRADHSGGSVRGSAGKRRSPIVVTSEPYVRAERRIFSTGPLVGRGAGGAQIVSFGVSGGEVGGASPRVKRAVVQPRRALRGPLR
jgi:hypothetical protein